MMEVISPEVFSVEVQSGGCGGSTSAAMLYFLSVFRCACVIHGMWRHGKPRTPMLSQQTDANYFSRVCLMTFKVQSNQPLWPVCALVVIAMLDSRGLFHHNCSLKCWCRSILQSKRADFVHSVIVLLKSVICIHKVGTLFWNHLKDSPRLVIILWLRIFRNSAPADSNEPNKKAPAPIPCLLNCVFKDAHSGCASANPPTSVCVQVPPRLHVSMCLSRHIMSAQHASSDFNPNRPTGPPESSGLYS